MWKVLKYMCVVAFAAAGLAGCHAVVSPSDIAEVLAPSKPLPVLSGYTSDADINGDPDLSSLIVLVSHGNGYADARAKDEPSMLRYFAVPGLSEDDGTPVWVLQVEEAPLMQENDDGEQVRISPVEYNYYFVTILPDGSQKVYIMSEGAKLPSELAGMANLSSGRWDDSIRPTKKFATPEGTIAILKQTWANRATLLKPFLFTQVQ